MAQIKLTLPEGWRWEKLGTICEFTYGESLPFRGRNSEGKIPVYGSNGIIGYHDKAVTKGAAIIVGRKGSIGEVNFSFSPCYPIDTTYYIEKGKEELDLVWLYYWLKAINLARFNKAAAVPGLNRNDAYSVEIPFPPFDEQKRIAVRLDEQMRHIEQARQAAEESLSAAWDLPSAYLSSIFDGSDGHGWKWEKLDGICDLLPAKAIKSIGDTSVTAITSACLTENGFSPYGLKSARMDENDAKVALVKKDEILIARSNTPELVGRVSIYPGDPPNVVASDLTIRIWAKPSCYPPFLNAYLSFLYLSGYWKEKAGGASGTMKKITRSQLLDIKVPVPDIKIQKKIVDEMQEKMSHFKQLEQSLESQLAEINELPSALLRQAFAGEL